MTPPTMRDTTILQGKHARYCTLGCKLNFAETASIAQQMARHGVLTAHDTENADIVIVNTCAVTATAAAKCRQAISKVVRQNKGAAVVVIGCYAQLEPQTVARLNGVSLVLGNEEKAHIIDHLTAFLLRSNEQEQQSPPHIHTVATKEITSFAPSCARGNRTRYFLKVQDGCNYYCTYCAIPFARGHSRNPSIASLVAQAQQAAANGAHEIVLTGVNIGDFGRSTGETFLDLLRALEQVDGIDRYRVSSLEPDLCGDALITFCATESKKVMPHFHIPLQSGADNVLRLMHRRYDTHLFANKVRMIKTLLPQAFIGIDVMVGCRGETGALFAESYAFIKELDISKIHVFPYSERENTAALRITPIVTQQEKHQRAERLLALSEEKQHAFYAAAIGTVRPVLFEKTTKGGKIHGFTDNYIRVELSSPTTTPPLDNSIHRVSLTGFTRDGKALESVLAE